MHNTFTYMSCNDNQLHLWIHSNSDFSLHVTPLSSAFTINQWILQEESHTIDLLPIQIDKYETISGKDSRQDLSTGQLNARLCVRFSDDPITCLPDFTFCILQVQFQINCRFSSWEKVSFLKAICSSFG